MKKLFVIGFIFILLTSVKAQNVAVSDDDGYVANPSAMLDVQSTSKGLLIPRLTTAQRLSIGPKPEGLMVYDTNKDHFYFYNGGRWVNVAAENDTLWSRTGNNVYLYDPNANLGIGSTTPSGKLEVKANPTTGTEEPIFNVINNAGDTVFAIYNEGVRIYVNDDPAKSTGSKGGFAVGGFSSAKGTGNEFLRVTPDSVRIYVNEDFVSTKATGSKGGFAVGGFSDGKGMTPYNYLFVNNDSSRVYVSDSAAGFSVDNIEGGGSSGLFNIDVDNCFIGDNAGNSTNPIKIGDFSNWKGVGNTFIGNRAGFSNNDGKFNLFIGFASGAKNTGGTAHHGSYNTFLGFESGKNNIYGFNNIFLGYRSGYNNVGGINDEGSFNTFIGYESGIENTEGQSNTFLGYQSGSFNTTGIHNTYVGRWTGAGNPGVGTPGSNGSYNVFLGTEAGRYEVNSYRLCIDARNTLNYEPPLIYGEFQPVNNKRIVVIDGDSLNNVMDRTFFVNGDAGGLTPWFNDSDLKKKKNVYTIDNALHKVNELRGVYYHWKDSDKYGSGQQMGFIAQEAEDVVPEVVESTNNNYQMSYASLTALLVEAIKEQQKIIEELKKDNTKLQSEVNKINSLQSQINELKSILEVKANK
ncbi:MAG: hypothetical protein C0594_04670 [Marinilabiliales bacterium]|nr:MAG: hypothetical protein C0594_04670 [Marinilabiliales bacterium]